MRCRAAAADWSRTWSCSTPGRCFTTWVSPSATAPPPCASRWTAPTRRESSCCNTASTKPTPTRCGWASPCTPLPGIPEFLEPEVALVTAGVETDVSGIGRNELSAEALAAVTAAHPRPDFKQRILAAFNDGMKHRPHSTFGTVNADVLAHFDPTFVRDNFVEIILEQHVARIAESSRQMDIYEGLYTTRMMRKMWPDAIPLETQARIVDAAIRAPNGGNTQRWHFLAVDDPELIRRVRPAVPTGPRPGVREVQDGGGTDGSDGARCGPGRARRNNAPNERLGGLPGRPLRRNSPVALCLRHRRPRRRQHLPGDSGVCCSPPAPRASAAS